MAVTVKPISFSQIQSPETILKTIREVFSDLEDQLNNRSQVLVNTQGKIPPGLNQDDLLVIAFQGVVEIFVKQSKSYLQLTAAMLGGIMSLGTNFKGVTESTTAPALADYPNDKDWGFHIDNGAPDLVYLTFNHEGVIRKVQLT